MRTGTGASATSSVIILRGLKLINLPIGCLLFFSSFFVLRNFTSASIVYCDARR